MTAYVVRKGSRKKKGILEKHEAELLHYIKSESSGEKLANAAEKVRAAQTAVIKCLRHETEAVKPEDEVRFTERRQHLERNRDHWEAVSTAEIIEQYRNQNPEPKTRKLTSRDTATPISRLVSMIHRSFNLNPLINARSR